MYDDDENDEYDDDNDDQKLRTWNGPICLTTGPSKWLQWIRQKKPLDSIRLDNFSTNQVKVGFETAMLFSSLISYTVKLSTKVVFFSTGTCRQLACFVLKASNVDVSR